MTTEQQRRGDQPTVSTDYGASYYADYGSDHLPYSYDEPAWQLFFGGIAERLVALFDPQTSYDAGCAKGFLVRALAEKGVDARGGDISEHAIEGAPPGLAERLEVKDLTEPFDQRFDLITCFEVLEHMSPKDARRAVKNLCAASDLVLISSTPDDFAEPTHVNIRPAAEWAKDFAIEGFFRRTDVDASFIAPWAVVFQRNRMTAAQLVGAYEALLAPMTMEVAAKRQALLEAHRDLGEALLPVNKAVADAIAERDELVVAMEVERERVNVDRESLLAERNRLVDRLDDLGLADLEAERQNRLAMADELIGSRAELARVRIQAENAVIEAGREAVRLREVLGSTQGELRTALSDIDDLRASMTWRIGRVAMSPVRWARLPGRLARGFVRRAKRMLQR